MTEAAVQSKILKWLAKNNFWVFKTVVCNRSGIMDIIACSPKGRFVGIEVKATTGGVTSKLQAWNIEEVLARGGIAFVANSLEVVIKNLEGEY